MSTKTNTIFFTGTARENLKAALLKWISVFSEKYGDSGVSRLRANDLTPASLEQELTSLPFLCEKRLVIIDGFPFSKNTDTEEASTKKESEKELKKELETTALRVLGTLGDTTFVIFSSENPDKKSKLTAFLETEATIKRFDPPSEYDMQDVVYDRLPGLSRTNARVLISRIGKDSERLESAIRKLELFDDATLALPSIVDEAIPEKLEMSVFSLSDDLLGSKIDKALGSLETLSSIYPMRQIFATLVGAVRTTLYIAQLRLSGKSDSEIASMTGIHPFVLSKRSRLNEEKTRHLKKLFDRLVELEIGSKTGTVP